MSIKRVKVDTSLEKRILFGLILSKEFTNNVTSILKPIYFRDDHVKRMVCWCYDHFLEYDDCIKDDIFDLFYEREHLLSEDQKEAIKKILIELDESNYIEKSININYLTDQTINYFKKRDLEIRANNIKILLEEDQLEKAEDEALAFKKISKITSNWINPLESKEIQKHFDHKTEPLLKLPGMLGNFVGPFEAGWLVGITGPYKRGKTFYLQEFCIMGMFSRLPVVFFSLEMTIEQMKERFYKRLVPSSENSESVLYPVFDCAKNQSGSCKLPERTNDRILLNPDGTKPTYSRDIRYKTCDYCRTINHSEFEPDIWYDEINVPEYNESTIINKMSGIEQFFSKYYRMKAYPRFSANISDLERDLDILEKTEGYVPKLIAVDHADILKPERDELTGVLKEDETWMALARLASQRNCLVVTGTQATGDSLEAIVVTQKHTARWKGKLGHIDCMLALNQTREEKDFGIMRISVMAHRHKDFMETDSVTVLQQLTIGQAHLDSDFN